jgi:hypothetical protein
MKKKEEEIEVPEEITPVAEPEPEVAPEVIESVEVTPVVEPLNIIAAIDSIKALTDQLRDITDKLSVYPIPIGNDGLIARQKKDIAQAAVIGEKIADQAIALSTFLSGLPIQA